jgi:hypothetical protein
MASRVVRSLSGMTPAVGQLEREARRSPRARRHARTGTNARILAPSNSSRAPLAAWSIASRGTLSTNSTSELFLEFVEWLALGTLPRVPARFNRDVSRNVHLDVPPGQVAMEGHLPPFEAPRPTRDYTLAGSGPLLLRPSRTGLARWADEEDTMMRAKSSLVVLALLVSVACTSTPNQPSGGSSAGGGSAPEPPPDQSGAGGVIVFNRGTSAGIAVYSLDLDTGTERKIRDVGDSRRSRLTAAGS